MNNQKIGLQKKHNLYDKYGQPLSQSEKPLKIDFRLWTRILCNVSKYISLIEYLKL